MYPAGGFAQIAPHHAFFALQQPNFALRGRQLRLVRQQSATPCHARIDLPFFAKQIGRQGAVFAVLAEVFGGVEADAARADNRHASAHGLFVAQHIQIAQHFGPLAAGQADLARHNAAGEHDFIKALQISRGRFFAQNSHHAHIFQHLVEIAQRFRKFGLAGDLFGDIKLAADLVLRVKQRHLVAARCGGVGKRHARRARAHHGNVFGFFSRVHRHLQFVAGKRVHQARGEPAGENMVEAGLVAGDAGVDARIVAFFRFNHPCGIGQKGARHANSISQALLQNIFGGLRHIDAVGGHHGNAADLLELTGEFGKSRARHGSGDGGNARFVPADAGVEHICACRFDFGGQGHVFIPSGAVFHQVEQRDAVNHQKIITAGGADAGHDFAGEAAAVFGAAAVFVVARVGAGREKLVNQIAFAAHHFHAVVARFFGQAGAGDIVGHGLAHFFGGKRARLGRIDRRLNGAGCHRLAAHGITAGVQNLHADFRAVCVHGFGNDTVPRHFFGIGELGAAIGHRARLIGADAAGDNQRHAVFGALGVKSRQMFRALAVLFKAGVHRAHNHAVAQSVVRQHQLAGKCSHLLLLIYYFVRAKCSMPS